MTVPSAKEWCEQLEMAAVEKRTFDVQYVADDFSIHPHAHSMAVMVVLGLPLKWNSHCIVDVMLTYNQWWQNKMLRPLALAYPVLHVDKIHALYLYLEWCRPSNSSCP